MSLGTKLILSLILVEGVTLLSGVTALTWKAGSEQTLRVEQALSAQSDLIARDWPRKPLPEELDSRFRFQVIAPDGKVDWDTGEPKLVGRTLKEPHPLLRIASGSALKRGSTRFSIPEAESHLGTYRKLASGHLVVGAFPLSGFGEETRRAFALFLRAGIFLAGISILLSVFLVRKLVAPIRNLTHAMRSAGDGNFEIELPKPSRDEIGILQESFETLLSRLRILLAGEARSSRMEEEVNIAAEIQARLLPLPELRAGPCEIRSHYQSATETGGDFWGGFEAGNRLYLYVGDVTGHGLPSALVTAGVRGGLSALTSSLARRPGAHPLLSELLEVTHSAVRDIGSGELQMTLFATEFEFETRTLRYTSAGHPPAWLFKRSGESRILHARGPRLGEESLYSGNEENEVILDPGDTLLLYTDGLLSPCGTEVTPESRKVLRERIGTILTEESSLEKAKTAIEFMLFEQTRGAPPSDDISFTLMRCE